MRRSLLIFRSYSLRLVSAAVHNLVMISGRLRRIFCPSFHGHPSLCLISKQQSFGRIHVRPPLWAYLFRRGALTVHLRLFPVEVVLTLELGRECYEQARGASESFQLQRDSRLFTLRSIESVRSI